MDLLSGYALTTSQLDSDSDETGELSNVEEEEEEEEEQANGLSSSSRHQKKTVAFQKDKPKVDLRNTKTFRKLEQEIKDMNRRRKSRQNDTSKDVQAIYVDKDRAISVNGGAEDLKGDILKHRGNLIKSNRSGECEAAELQVILDQAQHEIRRGDPWKALSYLERAAYIRLDDVECLILKGKCLVALNRHNEALETIEKVFMKEGPTYSRAYGLKGDALYNLGQFEHALLNYHRGIRLATAKEKIDLGHKMHRVEAAVWNALREPSNQHFFNLDKLSTRCIQDFLQDSQISSQSPVKPRKQHNTKAPVPEKSSRDKKYLSELAKDKEYLGGILKKLSRGSGSSYQSYIQHQAKDGIQFLKDRRDFWEQQHPDYSIH